MTKLLAGEQKNSTAPYQVRRFRRLRSDFLLERSKTDYPMVHLFDEPQFNPQDGYIDILREVCGRFIFVERGRISVHPDFATLAADPSAAAYLGHTA